jgi:hypothetical protein
MLQSFEVFIFTDTHPNGRTAVLYLFECWRDCDIAVAMWHSLTSRVRPLIATRTRFCAIRSLARRRITDAMIALHAVEALLIVKIQHCPI